MNIAQLHERIKNLSDNQLAQMSKGEDTAASLALMVLNERNDIREESQAQKPKPPTIAEQERAKSGIGMPPVDPRMIPQNILAGVGNPNMMPMPQPRDSGVSQLPAPVMMADGGLVRLVDGGTPEENFDNLGFFADQTYFGEDGLIFDTTDPVDYAIAGAGAIPGLGAIGAAGKGIYNLATRAPKLFQKYKKARDKFDKKIAKKFAENPELELKRTFPGLYDDLGRNIGTGVKPTARFSRFNPLSRYAKPGTLRKDLTRGTAGAGIGFGLGSIASGDDPSKKPDKPSSDAIFDKFRGAIDKLSEQQSTPKKEPSSKKASTGGLADLAIQTGLRFAAGETLPKAILQGSEFIAGQKEKAADRKLKKDALELEKRGQDLVLQAAGLKAGLNQNQLSNLKLKVEKEYGDQIDSDVARLVAEQEKGLPFFRTKVTNEQKKRLRKALFDQKVQEILLSNTGGLANIGGNQIDLNVLNRLIADKQS